MFNIVIRSLMLLVIYALLARGIMQYRLTTFFLTLPMAVEVLTVLWLGWFLNRFIVPFKTFAGIADKPKWIIFWSVSIIGLFLIVLIWDSDSELPSFDLMALHGIVVWQMLFRSGVIWAVLVAFLVPIANALFEVRRWRLTQTAFAWSSMTHFRFRVGAMILYGFFASLAFLLFGDDLEDILLSAPRRLEWTVFGVLLLVDVTALGEEVTTHFKPIENSDKRTVLGKKKRRNSR